MDIILITKHFPYNRGGSPGETFLDSEINVLSKRARMIYVIAVDAAPGSEPSISLPENVSAIAIGSAGKYTTKLKGLAAAGSSFFAPSAALKEELPRRSVRNRLYARYFDARARIIADRACRFLRDKSLEEPLIYSYWFYYHAEAAILLKERLGGKCFSRAHGYDLYEYNRKGNYLPFRWYLLKNIDRVFPCSVMGAEYLTKKFSGAFRRKIIPCYLGTEDHGTGMADRRTIISCSRAVTLKRLGRIAETLADMDNVRWVHFGDGPELASVREYCEKKGIDAEFKGFTPNREVLEYYGNNPAAVFINVSTTEGLPLSIMEAMSFGIPVIATDVGGVSEIVIDGKTGFLLDKDFDNQQLKTLIEKIMSLPEEDYQQLRENCRKIWEENFMYKRNSEKMLEEVLKA